MCSRAKCSSHFWKALGTRGRPCCELHAGISSWVRGARADGEVRAGARQQFISATICEKCTNQGGFIDVTPLNARSLELILSDGDEMF